MLPERHRSGEGRQGVHGRMCLLRRCLRLPGLHLRRDGEGRCGEGGQVVRLLRRFRLLLIVGG
jgi:hypothetical protein